jgi:NADH:ubiquinone oxidoreductase subunit 4 (subunit M)
MMLINSILSTMIWLPILAGISLLFLSDNDERAKNTIRYISLGASLATLLLNHWECNII